MVSKETIIAKRESIIQQRDNAFAIYNQAVGALTLLEHLIHVADECSQEVKVEDLANAIGAESVEVMPVGKDGG